MPKRYLEAAQIAAAQRGFQTLFNSIIAGIEDPVKQLAMIVPSDANEEEYDWFEDIPGLRRWLDDRPLAKLAAKRMRIENLDYASGLEVDKNDIADDRLRMIQPRIAMLAQKAGLHASYLIGQWLLNGFDGTVLTDSDGKSFDGQYFFSAAHPYGKGLTYDNLETAALAHDSYFTARSNMASYVDTTGKYALGIRGTTLVVGPSLERTALEILESKVRSDGQTSSVQIDNVMAGTAKLLISDALVGSYVNYWFLCDLSKPIKPLIYQPRQEPIFEAADDPKSDDPFMRRRLKYGASARIGIGYGEPHYCYGSNGTT
jgi:phage major head subunit gpT-like protein